jgi:peptide/histidine transporter 3/4
MCVSAAGSRFNQATMGADQFDSAADRDVLFNWYFVFYASSAVGSTAIVYVQDNVSWALGYALSGAASLAGLAALLADRRPGARGSPFTGLARVAVAAVRKRKVVVHVATSGELKFYHGRRRSGGADDRAAGNSETGIIIAPSDSFRYGNNSLPHIFSITRVLDGDY